jgi:RND family efflux transporter MFP subunit
MKGHFFLFSLLLLTLFSIVAFSEEKNALSSVTKKSGSVINNAEKKVPLSIVPVKVVTVPANQVLIAGTVAAHKSVILSAQMPGRVVSISGEEGDRFNKGVLLLKINDDELRAKRQVALAQFHTATIAAQNAGVQFHRQMISPSTSNNAPGGMGLPGMFDQIFTNRMGSVLGTRKYGVERGADIFNTRAQLDQAHQALEQARSQIQQIDTLLRDTMSIAPFDGVIVTKHVEVGDTVQPGQPLLKYEDLDILQIKADVPGRLVQRLKQGALVNARVDGSNDMIQVTVNKIFPTSDPVRHTTHVEFNIPAQAAANISPGNYAEVSVPVSDSGNRKDLLIPASAVIERGGLPSVFVINASNQTELRLVRLGKMLSSGEVVILYGVKEKERILDKPPAYVTSGYKMNKAN